MELQVVEGSTEQVAMTANGDEATALPEDNGATAKTKRSKSTRGSANALMTDAEEDRGPVDISIHTLLKAGVHFGHQTSRWHPAMAPFIYGVRNGIHIINLPKTIQAWKVSRQAIVDCVAKGGKILFIGTKKQAQDELMREANRCGAFFVTRRWLGGMVTNFQTIRRSIERMKKLEELLADEEQRKKYTKKELLMMDREREKLDFSLAGIRDMHAPPQMAFIIDVRREDIAVKEMRKLDIPIVALVDTNCSPDGIDFPIPSNDDSTRAIRLFAGAVCDAVQEGQKIYAERAAAIAREQSEREAEEKKAKAQAAKEAAKKKEAEAAEAAAAAPEAEEKKDEAADAEAPTGEQPAES